MRLLAAADIHGSQYRLNIILHNIEEYQPDLVVICGDITQFGPGETATNFLNQIPVETLALPGNIDSADVGEAIQKSKATNIDLQRVVKYNFSFVGIGGVPPSFSRLTITDGRLKKPLEKIIDSHTVLVTHIPPYKLQDRVFIGSHAGSKELRHLVDTYEPRLVLCAHIHEDPGVTVSGKTTVVNCSLGKRTEGALITINETVKVTILE